MSRKAYLIPTPISEDSSYEYLPKEIRELRYFVVEEEKAARRFLKKAFPDFPLVEAQYLVCNEHSSAKEIQEIMKAINGQNFGVISEAGCPCVADPGSEIVLWAHGQNYEIVPLVGPSSIMLALMASGLSGQNFAFVGYLPKEKEARIRRLKDLEARSRKEKQTQIFMETPYRNQQIFDEVLQVCSPVTLFTVAVDLTAPEGKIRTSSIADWKRQKQNLPKSPALFLIYAGV